MQFASCKTAKTCSAWFEKCAAQNNNSEPTAEWSGGPQAATHLRTVVGLHVNTANSKFVFPRLQGVPTEEVAWREFKMNSLVVAWRLASL